MNQNKDVFEGRSVPATIAKFAIPTVLSQLVTLIYNLADTYFVGKTNNPSQVAALTLSFPIFMTLTMMGNLFGIGANSFISRSLGQGDKEEAKKASTFAFYGAIVGVALIMLILGVFMTPILTAIGAKSVATFKATKEYLTWTVIFGGIPTVASMMLGHLIRAEGNTKQASIGMVIGGVLNIVLDAIFVLGLSMGAKGAAIATCISNIVAFLYLLIIVLRTKGTVIELNPVKLRLIGRIISQVILVGIPAAAIIVLGSSANMILTHFMSDYGDISIAAFGIVQKIGSIAIQITVGLSQGIMPLLGYCYGAGDMKRLKAINKTSFIILGVYAGLCILMVEIFAKPLVNIFISEPATVEKGIQFLRVWFLCAPGMCFTNLFGSIFQAMGKWLQSLLLSLIRQAVILIPLIILLNRFFGEFGLVCGQPIADSITLVVGIIMYIVLMRKWRK
jgi:putative MATE family efflux protein